MCNCYVSTVKLTSIADSVCPGDTVVFTCVTDTGRLVWSISNNNELYYQSGQVSEAARIRGIFTLKLINATGNVFISTATAYNVSVEFNGITINCSDKVISSGTTAQMETIIISIKY